METIRQTRPKRLDIQGLRAIAVLAVLLYHLKVPGFSGGFVGVDVFFVISGFLITKMLWTDSDHGLLHFAYRRLQRLMPASLVTLLITFAISAVILSPSTLKNVAAATFTSAITISSFWLWWTTDYFSDDARMQPLLHMWSLSVEWWFYALWMGVIALALRLRRPFLIVGVAATISFALNFAHSAIYYPFWDRVFEFSVGAFIVWLADAPIATWKREVMSLAGIGLIVFSVLYLDQSMPFPSYNALLPCIGAFLIILANSNTIGGRVLGSPGMFWIGEISYSIYLVHWPIIILSEIAVLPRLDLSHQMLLFAVSIVGGWLLYEVAERPFLPRKQFERNKTAERIFVPLFFIVLAISGHAYWTVGWPWRQAPAMRALLASARVSDPPPAACFFNSAGDYSKFDFGACMKSIPGKRNVLLLGDSFAAYAYTGLKDHKDWNVMLNTVTGCQPVVGVFANFGKACIERNKDIMANFDRYKADEIYLMGNWRPEQAPALAELLAFLKSKGQHVTVIGPTLRFTKKLIDIVATRNTVPAAAKAATAFIPPEMFDLDEAYAAVAEKNGASYFSPVRQLCTTRSPSSCAAIIDGKLVSFDQWHLLPPAAKALFKDLR